MATSEIKLEEGLELHFPRNLKPLRAGNGGCTRNPAFSCNPASAIGVYRSSLARSTIVPLRRTWLLSLAFSTSVCLFASERIFTEAENDSLAGRIRSVSTVIHKFHPPASQPDGLSIYLPVLCEECEYDPAGNRIKQSEIRESDLVGTTSHQLLDGAGHMQEQVWENEKGEVQRRTEFKLPHTPSPTRK